MMFILAEMGKKRLKRKNGVPTSGNERQTETDQWKKAKEIENVEKKNHSKVNSNDRHRLDSGNIRRNF